MIDYLHGYVILNIISLVRSNQSHRTPGAPVRREFGLGLALMVLFVSTWFAHGVAQYQTYSAQQKQHGQPVEVGGIFAGFNWQSEFLQLFAFVVSAGLYIHRGNAASRGQRREGGGRPAPRRGEAGHRAGSCAGLAPRRA